MESENNSIPGTMAPTAGKGDAGPSPGPETAVVADFFFEAIAVVADVEALVVVTMVA